MHFDWLDVAAMIEAADMILEYPMVDRDPIGRWTVGRVTLLGDAAHPMYPRGSNGAAQAILDADLLSRLLTEGGDAPAILQAYEAERLPATAKIVRTNRSAPPDTVINLVEERTNGAPFERREDVISDEELARINDGYKAVTGYSKDALKTRGTA
jgi:2-polyprenyl-6-methoxyphenol hydroxylase-like FAD-dependent oxidoreductase